MGMPSWKADVLAKVATVTKIRDLAGYSTTVRIYKSTRAPRLSSDRRRRTFLVDLPSPSWAR